MANLQKPRFHKVNIEISNICNLQCSFCPEVIREKKMMSVDMFRNAIQQVAPMTEQVCLHLMGDPLVHPKLDQMVQICEEFQARVFLVTNGLLMRAAQSELLLNPVFRQVNFSLHSFPDNFPENDPADYLKRIFVYTEKAFQKRPDLYINYRLWNLQDVHGTETKNKEMLQMVAQHFGITIDATDIDVRKKKSVHLLNRLYLHFDTEFVWPSLDLPFLGRAGRCYGLTSHFGILADGTVVPCCLDKEGKIPLGHISNQTVEEILSSPRATEILNGFNKRKLVNPLCQRCNYIERFQNQTILDSESSLTF